MRETIARVERDDFYSTRGKETQIAPNAPSSDWFEQATGCKRPPLIAPAVHSLGPLFAESTL
ncbi:MAG: hypothetical protein ACLP3K_11530 [Candidatus Acidiferrales bacterium]